MKNGHQANVDEFFDEMIESVVKFKAYWRAKQSRENFPAKLFLGEWDEQFQIFLDAERNK